MENKLCDLNEDGYCTCYLKSCDKIEDCAPKLLINKFWGQVNRIEVIDSKGRSYTNYDVKGFELSLQDDNRTLKIFIK